MKPFLFFSALFFSFSASASMLPPELGVTALMRACRDGSIEQVRTLLAAGAKVDERTCDQYPPRRSALNYAVRGAKPFEATALLLEHGARVERAESLFHDLSQARYGKSPEQFRELEKTLALLLGRTTFLLTPNTMLCNVIRYGVTDRSVFERLLELGADVNSRLVEAPPLICALSGKNQVAFEFLLEHKADPNIRDRQNIPAVNFAANAGQLKRLIEAGAAMDSADAWLGWIDAELLKTVLAKGCKVGEKGVVAAGGNPHLPELLVLLAENYNKPLPLGDMAFSAAKRGRIGNLKFLAGRGVSFQGETPFIPVVWDSHELSAERKLETVQFLLAAGAAPDAAGEGGVTMLMKCAGARDLVSMELLLKHGADAKRKDNRGWDTLYCLLSRRQYGPLEQEADPVPVLRLLMKHGVRIDGADKNGCTPLHTALLHEQTPALIRALVESGAAVNAAAATGVTPLMLSAMYYPAEITKFMLDRGARINDRDDTGWNALFYATRHWPKSHGCLLYPTARHRNDKDAAETVALLIERGIDAKSTDRTGASALTQAGSWAGEPTLRLLFQAGGKEALNATDRYGRNAILYAGAYNQDRRALPFLLECGADPNSYMRSGKYPEREEGFEISSRRAKFGVGIRESYHNSAGIGWIAPLLALVASRQDAELVKLLLDHGADANIKHPDHGEPAIDQFAITTEIAFMLPNRNRKSLENFVFEELCRYEPPETLAKLYAALPPMDEYARIKLLDSSLRKALANNSLDSVRFLIDAGGNLYESLIWNAVRNSNHPEVLLFLLKETPGAAAENREVLFSADSPAIVDILVARGADVNHREKRDRQTPLHRVCETGLGSLERFRLMEALLRHGADPNARTSAGVTPAALLLESERGEALYRMLELLARHGARISPEKQ